MKTNKKSFVIFTKESDETKGCFYFFVLENVCMCVCFALASFRWNMFYGACVLSLSFCFLFFFLIFVRNNGVAANNPVIFMS